ncbi:MAG: hypothetical protein DRH08_05825 [Deltaproteobacteria bacterium]|nr:MAG: hypothetical protein DRH08_05825 [Deltaproteobacteria bacterium]
MNFTGLVWIVMGSVIGTMTTLYMNNDKLQESRKIDKEIAACEKPLVRTTHCVAVVIPVGALEAYAKLLDDHVE